MSKLWQKDNVSVNEKIEKFTVGRDPEFDVLLAEFDVLGSLAHTQMLESIGLLEKSELSEIQQELKAIYQTIQSGDFIIEEGIEDVHSQVELMLTRKLGEAGKKIHSGRSRNDQVLVDLKLFTRSRLQEVAESSNQLFELLISLSEKFKEVLLPGYTHLQIAMPSSFGLWFGAYAESLVDDMEMLQTAYRLANKNPLGSGAGYGSSFPLNRTMTTELLGFDNLHYNVVYAQMSRGKTELFATTAIAQFASTLSRLAMDICLYNSQNFGFIKLPDEMTTGSSIMPHKKNPDVAELLRGKTNRLKGLPNEIMLVMGNLPSGYHREMQILKEILMPAFDEILNCLDMTYFMLSNIQVKEGILEDTKYDLLFSVERVNELVLQGVPFREAYKIIGNEINSNTYTPNRDLKHSHEGSIGNLCNDQITVMMQEVIGRFGFEKVQTAVDDLLK
ncbi:MULTISPECIES: argininosuccinate lyase [unclassified Arcicella]|uniref:argininosuccinate lyase n=1 Tax=unclassified Arcicella TaxID=2644986 RepID=UPI002859F586|nr:MULTISPECIES: argininosuccinate lyase [unclassified Arcicella]MDR6560129.1 argininosuccinate lyase [Arcicella sp. BE51]MDR6810264.1 argininosuccinate lyase [Arcicella sp. BE140]MDR6821614.1 argininosuccinate lyase [Arcicella sp. BE139]